MTEANWSGVTRNGRGLVRPATTDRTAASPSILAFGGLLKPSADQRITIRAAAANAMRR